jgi:hypothetical protein
MLSKTLTNDSTLDRFLAILIILLRVFLKVLFGCAWILTEQVAKYKGEQVCGGVGLSMLPFLSKRKVQTVKAGIFEGTNTRRRRLHTVAAAAAAGNGGLPSRVVRRVREEGREARDYARKEQMDAASWCAPIEEL